MLSIAIVIFREFFEISIIMTVLLLATEKIKKRQKYIWLGILIGVAGSLLLAIFTNKLTDLAGGYGQEIVNIMILSLAVFMIGWTVMWMKNESVKFSKAVFETGKMIEVGNKHKIILSLLIASAIFREGSEIVLFVSGALTSEKPDFSFFTSIFLGGISGLAFGLLFYLGIIKFALKYIFSFTSLLLILFGSSLSSQIAKNLIQADFCTILSAPLWDSSWLISNNSVIGQILYNAIGYNAHPSGLELSFYVVTLAVMLSLKRWSLVEHKNMR